MVKAGRESIRIDGAERCQRHVHMLLWSVKLWHVDHSIFVKSWARHRYVQILLRVHFTEHYALISHAVVLLAHGEHISRSAAMNAVDRRRISGNDWLMVTDMRERRWRWLDHVCVVTHRRRRQERNRVGCVEICRGLRVWLMGMAWEESRACKLGWGGGGRHGHLTHVHAVAG